MFTLSDPISKGHVGDWVLSKPLGKGQYSTVYLGTHKLTGDTCALKLMPASATPTNSRADQCYRDEVAALVNMQGKHLLNLKQYGCQTEWDFEDQRGICNYMAIEFAAGGELMDYLLMEGHYALGEKVSRYLFFQVLQGLKQIHERGFAHRDLKPENLLFDSEFNLRIADFGFAAPLVGDSGDGLFRAVLGTESYMAPEIHSKRPYKGEQVDVFAAGVILFIMVMRRPPFGKAIGSDAYYYKFCREP